MTAQELKDTGFDVKPRPELTLEQKDRKKDYGNKYMKNKHAIWTKDTLFGKLEAIQQQRGFSTKGELFEYLIELDTIAHPELKTVSVCKKCNQELDVPQNANLARLVHMDLEKNSQCNGSIINKQKIVKNATDKKPEAKDPNQRIDEEYTVNF